MEPRRRIAPVGAARPPGGSSVTATVTAPGATPVGGRDDQHPPAGALRSEETRADGRRAAADDPHLVDAPGRRHRQLIGNHEQPARRAPVRARSGADCVLAALEADRPHVGRGENRQRQVRLAGEGRESILELENRRPKLRIPSPLLRHEHRRAHGHDEHRRRGQGPQTPVAHGTAARARQRGGRVGQHFAAQSRWRRHGLGRGRKRVHQVRVLAELGPAGDALLEMRFDRAPLVRRQVAEGVLAEHGVDRLVLRGHGRRLPRSAMSAVRMRVFTVPSGGRKTLGDLRLGQPLEVRELEGHALFGRQRRKREAKARGLLVADDLIGRRNPLAGQPLEHVVAGRLGPRLARAQPVDGARARHHQQPPRDGAASRLIPSCRAPDLSKDLLHHVFRVAVVAQDPPREREHAGRVAVVQLRRGVLVASRQPAHELDVFRHVSW